MAQGKAPTPWPVLIATNVMEMVLHTVRTLARGAALRSQIWQSRATFVKQLGRVTGRAGAVPSTARPATSVQ
jgi:hypothetical protein